VRARRTMSRRPSRAVRAPARCDVASIATAPAAVRPTHCGGRLCVRRPGRVAVQPPGHLQRRGVCNPNHEPSTTTCGPTRASATSRKRATEQATVRRTRSSLRALRAGARATRSATIRTRVIPREAVSRTTSRTLRFAAATRASATWEKRATVRARVPRTRSSPQVRHAATTPTPHATTLIRATERQLSEQPRADDGRVSCRRRRLRRRRALRRCRRMSRRLVRAFGHGVRERERHGLRQSGYLQRLRLVSRESRADDGLVPERCRRMRRRRALRRCGLVSGRFVRAGGHGVRRPYRHGVRQPRYV
jgi:hypothetical protein